MGTSRGVRLRFWWNWNMLKRIKKNEIRVFFYRPKNGLREWKLHPKFALKNRFFFNISKNNYIFLVKPMPKYFFIKRQSRVQNFCFAGLHPIFFFNINIFFEHIVLQKIYSNHWFLLTMGLEQINILLQLSHCRASA